MSISGGATGAAPTGASFWSDLSRTVTVDADGKTAAGVKPGAVGQAASEPRSGESREVAKSVCKLESERIIDRYVRRRISQRWLWGMGIEKSNQRDVDPSRRDMRLVRSFAGRVAMCGQRIAAPDVRYGKSGSVAVHGVATCGSIWACPVCASVLRSVRSAEIEYAAGMHMSGKDSAGRGDDGSVGQDEAKEPGMLFLTLTIRHDRYLPLEFSLDVLLDAYRRMQAGKWWRQLAGDYGIAGGIKSVEVTYSLGDGWHPHLHLLFFTRYALDDAQYERFCRLLRESVQPDGGGRPTQPWAGWVERAANAARKRHLSDRYEIRCCPAVMSEIKRYDGSSKQSPGPKQFAGPELVAVAEPGDWVVSVRDLVSGESVPFVLDEPDGEDGHVEEVFDRRVCRSEEEARGIAAKLAPVVGGWNDEWRGKWAEFDVKRLCPDAEHGFDLERCSREWSGALSRYICKLQDEHDPEWTVGAELTRGDVKDASRNGDGDVHITPFQLLDDDCPLKLDVKRRQALWAEFVSATRGRRAVVWTPGLKSHFDIEPLSDDQVLAQAREHIDAVWQLDEAEYERIRREDPVRLAKGLLAFRMLKVGSLAALLPGRWVKRPDDELVYALSVKDSPPDGDVLELADAAFWRQLRDELGLKEQPPDWRGLAQGLLDLDGSGGDCVAAA